MAKFQQKYERTESNQPQTPEQYLWTSVLSKAAHAAIYTSDWLEARKAIAWFKSKVKILERFVNWQDSIMSMFIGEC